VELVLLTRAEAQPAQLSRAAITHNNHNPIATTSCLILVSIQVSFLQDDTDILKHSTSDLVPFLRKERWVINAHDEA
jgi:hypothetical protein